VTASRTVAAGSLTLHEFARKLRARAISAVEMTDECLRRIESENPRLNAFILVMKESARREAEAADRELAAGRDRGVLHGVPVSLKDLFDVSGTATTAASRVRDGHLATEDAPAVTLLRQAGAVVIGKTNLHEFAFGTTNEDSAFGPARNPIDVSRSPGGSSGGSAASVAAGMALATLGTDTGGSIRIPAAACGIVGLKPALGEVQTDGVVPLSKTLDHVGPLTRDVTDAWSMYHALLGQPAARPLSAQFASTLRLAVPRRYFFDVLDDGVRDRVEASLEKLRTAGARVDEVDIPHADSIATIYLHLVLSDAAAYHGPTLDVMPEKYTKGVRVRLEMGRYILAEDYVHALAGRAELRREVDAAMSHHDVLLLPTLPIPAPPIGAATIRVGDRDEPVRNLMLRLTQLFNLTGHPAISLPCGNTPAALPCGLQLVGSYGKTDALLGVALAVEKILASD
jgi:aspartyl-tRNA(Asn)/glutamyl-tRNA(Gln) amidotransferase subunit A